MARSFQNFIGVGMITQILIGCPLGHPGTPRYTPGRGSDTGCLDYPNFTGVHPSRPLGWHPSAPVSHWGGKVFSKFHWGMDDYSNSYRGVPWGTPVHPSTPQYTPVHPGAPGTPRYTPVHPGAPRWVHPSRGSDTGCKKEVHI